MPGDTWYVCCEIALERIQKIHGLVAVRRPRTIGDWHRKFHILGEQFANPAIIRKGGRPSLPPFFDNNRDAKDNIIKLALAKENLPLLSTEYMHSFLHNQLLPQLTAGHHGNKGMT